MTISSAADLPPDRFGGKSEGGPMRSKPDPRPHLYNIYLWQWHDTTVESRRLKASYYHHYDNWLKYVEPESVDPDEDIRYINLRDIREFMVERVKNEE